MSEFKFRTNPGLSQPSFEQPSTVSDSRGGGNPIQKHVHSPMGRRYLCTDLRSHSIITLGPAVYYFCIIESPGRNFNIWVSLRAVQKKWVNGSFFIAIKITKALIWLSILE